MLKRFSFLLFAIISIAIPAVTAQPGDPCDPVIVADVQTQLIDEGFDCLEGAGPFACVDDVFNYALENCPPPIDTSGNGNWNPCDPAVVADVVAQLTDEGFDCLVGAGPFACVDDVFNYAFENCGPPADSSDCDPAVVADLQAQLIDGGFDCLVGAGPFACVDDVFNYAFENCPPPIDTSGCGNWNPCDSAVVADVVAQLIDEGFDCLEGEGPFDCVQDVLDYAFANCPGAIDSTGWDDPCDSAIVADVQAQLIADGFDCLEGAGPFACVDDVFNYAFENCGPPIDSFDCDPAAVAALQAQLIDEGYDCLVGAGPFTCEHEVFCYALENCPLDIDTNWIDLPDCLLDIPADIQTIQQFLQYIVTNCDSSVTADISPCWLSAPMFDNDEDFLEWLAENCPDDFDNLATGDGNQLLAAFKSNTSTATKLPTTNSPDLQLSPNPASTAFEIRISNNSTISRVELLDFSGKMIYSRSNVQSSHLVVPVEKWAQGIYLVKVYDQNARISVQKLIKQ